MGRCARSILGLTCVPDLIKAVRYARWARRIGPWKAIVELLDEHDREVSPGQPGKVVITDLFNRATPIIRYAGLGDIPHVSKFQIRQEADDHIRVLLVKDTVQEAAETSFAHDSQLGRTILSRFDRILDRQVRVDLHTVPDIPRRPGSHKFATVLSLVTGN